MKTLAVLVCLGAAAAGPAPAKDEPNAVPTTFIFEEICMLAPTEQLGEVPEGHRQRVPITGGQFIGPGIRGRVVSGGADTQLIRPDHSFVVDAAYELETDDSVRIRVHNVGVLPPPPGARYRSSINWAAPVFEAPLGRYGWLNSGIYVSSVEPVSDPGIHAVRVRVYRVGAE